MQDFVKLRTENQTLLRQRNFALPCMATHRLFLIHHDQIENGSKSGDSSRGRRGLLSLRDLSWCWCCQNTIDAMAIRNVFLGVTALAGIGSTLASTFLRNAEHISHSIAAEVSHADGHFAPIDFWDDLFRLMIFMSAVFVAGKSVQILGGPSLIGEMLIGIALGPNIANYAPEPRSLILIGDFGLCLLMLEAGLEIDVSLLKQVGPRGLLIAISGALLPFSAAFGLAWLFKFSFTGAFAAGAALQPTSLAIVLGVMKKGGTLNTPTGQLIVAAAAIDDVIAVILLSEMEALANPTPMNFVLPVLSALGFLIVIGSLAVFVIPKVLSDFVLPRVPPQHREHLILGLILIVAIGLQSAAAAARSSYLLGALLAGLSFSTLRSSKHVWEIQVKRVLHWTVKLFFAATIGFEVPIRNFWSLKIWKHSAAFLVPVVSKGLVGFYAVPRSHGNILTIGTAMCARGEFGFIIAARASALGFLNIDQFASLMLPLLIAAIVVPFSLKAVIAMVDKKGRASFDKAEYDTAFDSAKAYKPVYYQMRLKCLNTWGLMNEVLENASKEDLQVMDARIHSKGKYADDVFYFRDSKLSAPVSASEDDEAGKKILKEVQDRLDDLYESFLQVSRSVTAASAQAQQNAGGGRRNSIEFTLTRVGSVVGFGALKEDDGASSSEIDLVFVRWLPGMATNEAEDTDDEGEMIQKESEGNTINFKALVKQIEKEENGGLTFTASRMASNATIDEPTSAFFAGGRRASVQMLSAVNMTENAVNKSTLLDSKTTADQQLQEGLVYNAARDVAKANRNRLNPHSGFSRQDPGKVERMADNTGMGYSRRSIDLQHPL